jgi:hypothetical protein
MVAIAGCAMVIVKGLSHGQDQGDNPIEENT